MCGESHIPFSYSPVAQSAERVTVNHHVAGSNPARGAILKIFRSLYSSQMNDQ